MTTLKFASIKKAFVNYGIWLFLVPSYGLFFWDSFESKDIWTFIAATGLTAQGVALFRRRRAHVRTEGTKRDFRLYSEE